jgi:ATP-binding cassette subfamily B protein
VLAVVVGLQFPLGQCATAASQRLALRTRHAYQMLALEHVSRSGPKALARPETVAGAQTAHEAADAVDRLAGDVIRLVGAAVTAVVLSVAVMGIDPAAGLLILCALAPTVLAFTRIAKAEEKGWPRIGAAARRAQYASEQLLQQRTGTELAALGSASKVVELARGRRREQMGVLDALIGVAMRWEAIAGGVTACLLTAALLILLLGQADGAGAAAALTGAISGLHAIRNVGYAAGAIVTAVPKMRAIDRCRETTVEEQPRVRAHSEELRARRVCVRYPGASADAVSDATITAERGEMIAIVGPNGAGKTSLVNALIGAVRAEGCVEIDGRDLSTCTSSDRAGFFGLLTQEFGRYEFTVREVVGLGGPGPVTDEDMARALVGAHADGLVAALPHGLDTQLGQQWHGVGLSGGQWQRLALARIHVRGAGIWILDEPTSAIDAETEEKIFQELRRTAEERITIVVSHRAWTLRAMDRIYVMDGGRIVQEGRYEELVDVPGRFAEIFAMQTR